MLLPASIVAYASCYALAFVFLLKRRVNLIESGFIALATMFSGVILYEIVYHYGFGLGPIYSDFTDLDIQFVNPLHPQFPLLFSISIVASPLIAWRYIRLNRVLLVFVLVSAVLFATWVEIGYPQYTWGGDLGTVGYWLNSATKVLAIAPAFLFLPPRQQSRPAEETSR